MPIQARIQMSKFRQDHACVFNKTLLKMRLIVFSYLYVFLLSESLVSYGKNCFI